MTDFSEIFDLFLSLVQDYRLITIYQSSGSSGLNTYLTPWIMYSVSEFEDVCNQSLVYDSGSQIFTETLTQKNKNILAQIMVRYWLQKEVQDVLQMNNFITDRDFKTHSSAQNLREKQLAYAAKQEEISQILLNYGFKNNDWESWNNQEFG